MPRGGARNNKPTALRILQGNPGKRPLNDREPKPANVAPEMPAGLDAFGRQCWRRNAPMLERLGVLTEADGDMLAVYCDAYSQWRRASAALRKIEPTDEEYRKVAVSVEKARDQMRFLASEFGLSPASRSRLKVTPNEEHVDPFEELFGRKQG